MKKYPEYLIQTNIYYEIRWKTRWMILGIFRTSSEVLVELFFIFGQLKSLIKPIFSFNHSVLRAFMNSTKNLIIKLF